MGFIVEVTSVGSSDSETECTTNTVAASKASSPIRENKRGVNMTGNEFLVNLASADGHARLAG